MERAAKRLVDEVKVSDSLPCSTPFPLILLRRHATFLQGAMKTAKYRKRCFDQIEGIVAENKALTAEVDQLRLEVGEKVAEMNAQEEHRLELTHRLADQYRQRSGQLVASSSCE